MSVLEKERARNFACAVIPGSRNNWADVTFSHAFQPIVDVESGAVVSYEVLIRGTENECAAQVLRRIDRGDLLAFDQYSREKALALAANLGIGCKLNLNFSPGALTDGNGKYLAATIACAERVGLKPHQIVVEITESEVIRDYEALHRVVDYFRQTGVSFAIDDFGAGYAGLDMLAEIQPNLLKLDMALGRNIHSHGPRQAIVRAICNICLDLGLDLISEGVEEIHEYEFFMECGISLFQGYLFGRPAFEALEQPRIPSASQRAAA